MADMPKIKQYLRRWYLGHYAGVSLYRNTALFEDGRIRVSYEQLVDATYEFVKSEEWQMKDSYIKRMVGGMKGKKFVVKIIRRRKTKDGAWAVETHWHSPVSKASMGRVERAILAFGV